MPNFDVKPLVFFIAGSKADLTQVQTYLGALHEAFYGRNVRHGGSIEYWEAYFVLGSQSFGVEYQSPRENFEKRDQFVFTAEKQDGSQFREVLPLVYQNGDTMETATKRWIDLANVKIRAGAQFAEVPFLEEKST